MPKTLYQKIWDAHVVSAEAGEPTLLYIDLQLAHEVTSPQAFDGLRQRGLPVRRPERTFLTLDHAIPTVDPEHVTDPLAAKMIATLRANAAEFGVQLFDRDSGRQGVVHVVGPELGLTQPGMTIVCGDSHTSTHGAFGALAFGIGTSEVEQVLATQTLLQQPSQTMQIEVRGELPPGVGAKDLILAIIAQIGVGGGTGYVLEYTGSAIRNLNMEERMTLCNMSIEAGARAGLVSPDETTIAYLRGREYAPQDFEVAAKKWLEFATEEGASFDQVVEIDARTLTPRVTWGTDPSQNCNITETIPANAPAKPLAYMHFAAGEEIIGKPIQHVFIGSCTNGRLSDLQTAAEIFKSNKVAAGVRAFAVPGSQQVKKAAEELGLDHIFRAAGVEWREPGCSSCLAMNPDKIPTGEYCMSTSNRNFEGRQGPGARTLLASPLTAAASAVAGYIADPRHYLSS